MVITIGELLTNIKISGKFSVFPLLVEINSESGINSTAESNYVLFKFKFLLKNQAMLG
jgi:hypothetical protein